MHEQRSGLLLHRGRLARPLLALSFLLLLLVLLVPLILGSRRRTAARSALVLLECAVVQIRPAAHLLLRWAVQVLIPVLVALVLQVLPAVF